ncbi:hypothetical protein BH18ACI1_BH18ACI1_07710 [soil metagenome]
MKKITSLFVFIIAIGGIFVFSNIIIVAQQPNNTLPNATGVKPKLSKAF